MRIRTVLESVPINQARAAKEELLASFFTPSEAQELEQRHPQTTAGFLALKRALKGLLSHRSQGCTEKDFVLSHGGDGAPILLAGPGAARARICLSISHTQQRAYGLAVLQEDAVGD